MARSSKSLVVGVFVWMGIEEDLQVMLLPAPYTTLGLFVVIIPSVGFNCYILFAQ